MLFSALFESLTKDIAQKYGSTVKNLTLGFSPKLSGGVPIHVWKSGKFFGQFLKSPPDSGDGDGDGDCDRHGEF